MGAMCAYGTSYLTGSPWLGVLAAGFGRRFAGRAARHDLRPAEGQRHRGRHRADVCSALDSPSSLGKPLIEPTAAHLPSIEFGWWSDIPQVKAALRINVLFLIGLGAGADPGVGARTTRWGHAGAHRR